MALKRSHPQPAPARNGNGRSAVVRSRPVRPAPGALAPTVKTVAQKRRDARLFVELFGLGLGLVGLILLFGQLGVGAWVPAFVGAFVGELSGQVGGVVLSLAFIAYGALLVIRGPLPRTGPLLMGWGLLFVVFLTVLQLQSATAFDFSAPTWNATPGGLIGGAFSAILRPAFGTTLATIVLTVVAIAGIVLTTGVTFTSLVRKAVRALIFLAREAVRLFQLPARMPASVRARIRKAIPVPNLSRIRTRVRARTTPTGAAPTAPARPEPTSLSTLPALPAPPAEVPQFGEPRRKRAPKADAPAAAPRPEPTAPFKDFQLPPISLLTRSQQKPIPDDTEDKMRVLEETLLAFGIEAKVVEIERGPRVTRYEILPPPGVRVSKISNLADNLALSLAALDVRVEAPVPGKGVIGIEVPHNEAVFVDLRELLECPEIQNETSPLAFALGKDITGHPRVAALDKMPHLLVAGATNSGKSVCLNAMIVSILLRARPDEVQFMLVDPKRVELSLFEGIPHLVAPVAQDVKQAAGLLRWAIREMESRYGRFADLGVRNITGFNERADLEKDCDRLPYLVIVIDELADLMLQAPAEIETSICRLAQLARATGIHLVVATQRPSVNVITGTIKANISSRIAFAVASQADSRVILDVNGAERLVGSGDMLFYPIDAAKPTRIQGVWVREADINKVVHFLRDQGEPVYRATPIPLDEAKGANDEVDESDEIFQKVLEYLSMSEKTSASMLQRKFRIGYNRASRLIDALEARGIVGPADGSKPREVFPEAITAVRASTNGSE